MADIGKAEPNPKTYPARPLLRCCDCVDVEHHADLPAKQIQQDRDPLTIRHSFIQAETCGERAVDDTDLVAGVKPRSEIQLDEPGVIMLALQCVDNGRRQYRGF